MPLTPQAPASTPQPFHALVVANEAYPGFQNDVVDAPGNMLCNAVEITGTNADAVFWRSSLFQSGASSVDVIGIDPVTGAAVPVSNGAFLDRYQALLQRVVLDPGTVPVLVFLGAGAMDSNRGPCLCFADSEYIQARGFCGAPDLAYLGRVANQLLPDRPLSVVLDCSFGFPPGGAPSGEASIRSATRETELPAGLTRFRCSDVVRPVDSAFQSDSSNGKGTYTASRVLGDFTAIELDPGVLMLRHFDVKPLNADTIIGALYIVGNLNPPPTNPWVTNREYWSWNVGATPWPSAFRLVPHPNPVLPSVNDLAAFEMYAQQQFPAANQTPLPTSVTDGTFYQLSKLDSSGNAISLDAHMWHHVGTTTSMDWYAVPGALSNNYLNLLPGESLVFTATTSPSSPNPQVGRHLVQVTRV